MNNEYIIFHFRIHGQLSIKVIKYDNVVVIDKTMVTTSTISEAQNCECIRHTEL